MRVFAPGAVVAGYRIEALVGRGGMGVVYRAREVDLDRVVALKVIAPELVEDDAVRARFLREARAAAAIEHPHVIPVHAAGEQDDIAYLAMRFIGGSDLRVHVRRSGPLAFEEAVDVIEQAAAGLDAIHGGGFVHRDIKPANLLIDVSGHVYVTDFGLAKGIFSHSGQTGTGEWVGTLDYVSPEQIRGGRVDARADIYALGGALHFALTAHVPFEHEGQEAKLWAQLSEPPPTPSDHRSGVPPALDAVVARALAKPADARFPSAGDLGRAARAALAGTVPSQPERMVARGAAAPAGAPTERGLAPEISTVTAERRTALLPARRRVRWVLPAIVLGAVLTVAIVAAITGRDPPPPRGDEQGAHAVPPAPAPHLEVGRTVHVDPRPNSLAFAGGDVWVAGGSHTRLTRIDPATARTRTQQPRVGQRPAAMVAFGDTLWVALTVDRRLIGIDARTGRVRHRIDVGARAEHLTADRSGVWVLGVTASGDYRLLHYDPAGKLRTRIALKHSASAVLLAAGALWIGNRRGPAISRVNRATGEVTDVLPVGAEVGALTYGAGWLWATLPDNNAIQRLNPRTGQRAVVGAGRAPAQALVIGRHLVVSSRYDHRVMLFDTKTMAEIDAVVVGLNPFALTYDGRDVWVSRLGDDQVTRIAIR